MSLARVAFESFAGRCRGRESVAERVLHLYLKRRGTVWLLDVYSKREKADLSPADVKAVKVLVDAIKASMP